MSIGHNNWYSNLKGFFSWHSCQLNQQSLTVSVLTASLAVYMN